MIDCKNTEMRVALATLIEEKMAVDDRVVIMNADLGASMSTGKITARFPERSIQVGIAEQNMASIAGGMSAYGCIPFIYSFAPFVTRRIFDQIMVSMAYAKQNVKIVGTDPGVVATLNGGTHMTFEDVALMRSVPEAVVFEPADAATLVGCFDQIMNYDGIVYIRLFRKVAPVVHGENYKPDLFTADVVKEGSDVTVFASGIMVEEALKAAEILKRDGISAEVIDVHTVKPLDEKTVISSVKKTGAAVTAENHSVMGGLRSAISECFAENFPAPLESVGVVERLGEVGSLSYLKESFGLTAANIAEKAKKAVSRKKA